MKAAVWLGVLVVVIAAAISVDTALYHDKVHAGVSVGGVTLGGLTEEEATAVLARYVGEAQARSLTLIRGDRTFEFTAKRAGVYVDVAGAVRAALGVTRDSNFVADVARRFALYFRAKDLPLSGTVDNVKMEMFLTDIAKVIDIPAVPAGLVINDGVVSVTEGRKGTVVDRTVLRERLTGLALSLRDTRLEIPVVIEEPALMADDTDKAVADAQRMVSAPVTLAYGERLWTLDRDDISAYIDVTVEEKGGVSSLVAYLSPLRMSPLLEKVSTAVAKKPVDATFKSDGKIAWVVPGEMGRALDVEATVKALTAAALKTTSRRAAAVVNEVEPELTAKKAEAMGIVQKLAGYETVYDCPPERQQNVRATTQYADKILAPGEIYNFDKQIGPRTEARGFALAPGIVGTGNLEDVLGGGICQVSTTLFNAVFEAGLEIIERHNHSLYLDHYPPGRDATVTDGGRNFQFRNDTENHIWVTGWSNGVVTRFSIYGTKDGRKVESSWSGWTYGAERTVQSHIVASLSPGRTVVERAGQSARSCTVTRKVTMPDGKVLHRGPEVYKSDFEMIPRIIQVAPPPTTTTTAVPGSEPSAETTVAPAP